MGNFKEESILICLVGTSVVFQISGMKFLQGDENIKSHFSEGAEMAFYRN